MLNNYKNIDFFLLHKVQLKSERQLLIMVYFNEKMCIIYVNVHYHYSKTLFCRNMYEVCSVINKSKNIFNNFHVKNFHRNIRFCRFFCYRNLLCFIHQLDERRYGLGIVFGSYHFRRDCFAKIDVRSFFLL